MGRTGDRAGNHILILIGHETLDSHYLLLGASNSLALEFGLKGDSCLGCLCMIKELRLNTIEHYAQVNHCHLIKTSRLPLRT